MNFTCKPCDAIFTTKANFERHIETDKHKKCCSVPVEEQQIEFAQIFAAINAQTNEIRSLKQTVEHIQIEVASLKEMLKEKTEEATLLRTEIKKQFTPSTVQPKQAEPEAPDAKPAVPAPLPTVNVQEVTKQKIIKPIKKTPSEKLLESAKQKLSDLNEKKLCYKNGMSYDKTHGEECSTYKFIKSSFNFLKLHDAEIQEMEACDKIKLMSYAMMLTKSKIVELFEMIDPYDMASPQNISQLIAECSNTFPEYNEFTKICMLKYREIAANHEKCCDP